jgi:putative chitinase
MNARDLSICTGARIDRAITFLPFVLAAMEAYEINTPARQAAFLAQVGHESGGLHWLVELWGPTDAQKRYEGRADIGNTQIGDGYKYRGRGLIQVTGRANYKSASAALATDLITSPEKLGQPDLACRSAGWFWQSHGLNALSDAGQFETITRRVNGGLNGQADRLALYTISQGVLA